MHDKASFIEVSRTIPNCFNFLICILHVCTSTVTVPTAAPTLSGECTCMHPELATCTLYVYIHVGTTTTCSADEGLLTDGTYHKFVVTPIVRLSNQLMHGSPVNTSYVAQGCT